MSTESLFSRIQPQSPGQEEIVKALVDKRVEIIGLFGPTGCGKSLFSIIYGVDAVLSGKYKRFILTRPLIDVVSGKELTAAELGEMYYRMVFSYVEDVASSVIEASRISELASKGLIVFADSHYLKGRTFDDSIVFIDDAQNLPVESAIEVVTRMGRNSRLIIAGDPVFQRSIGSKDSASMIRELLLGEESARVVDLGLKDIVRPGARRGIKLLLETKMRSRPLDETERQVLATARIHAPDADLVTVLNLVDLKKKYGVSTEHSPDALLIAKEGYQGRLIGKGGERINNMEKDLEMKLRAVELTLDFKPFIRAIHPVSWIYKHIVDVDFAGPNLAVKVESEGYAPFVGQKGAHVRYLEHAFRKLLDVGVRVYEVESTEREKARRKGRKEE